MFEVIDFGPGPADSICGETVHVGSWQSCLDYVDLLGSIKSDLRDDGSQRFAIVQYV